MVDLLPMYRAAEMLVQGAQGTEAGLTKVTAAPISIPGSTRGQILRSGLVFVPPNLLVGEDVVFVDFAAVLVDLLAVDAGSAGP